MLVVSCSIFHKRRRKVMALIPLKARSGIAALTFAAAVVPFVSATAAKATIVLFDDLTEMVSVLVTPPSAQIALIPGTAESLQVIVRSANQNPDTIKAPAIGGIRFVDDEGLSDVLQATITQDAFDPMTFYTQFAFGSDPDNNIVSTGFTVVRETGKFQQVGLAPNPDMGILDSQFRNSRGDVVTLPTDLEINVGSDVEVPGPVVGAGLPGLLAACVSLFAWWRRRPKIS
jgi:hypothetical protein